MFYNVLNIGLGLNNWKRNSDMQQYVVKAAKKNKVVFWLPYIILNHYNYTNCQGATKAKDNCQWVTSETITKKWK
jgi:hypothetical protein